MANFTTFGPHGPITLNYTPRRSAWEDDAGIRYWTPPPPDESFGRLAFSPDLVPLTQHPAIRDREGLLEAVLEARLRQFTVFTEHLELRAAVPVALDLRTGFVPISIPRDLARDAGKVVIDELGHSDAAERLRRDGSWIGEIWGVPPFLADLAAARNGLSVRAGKLCELTFTCVAETLITGALSHLPRDQRVRVDVRETMREHAREEAHHHALFGQLIGILWPQLSDDDRDFVGPLFARFIRGFLDPDLDAEAATLVKLGFSQGEAAKIVEEAREDGEAGNSLREAASPTTRFLARYGLLEHDITRRTLEARRLI